MKRKSSFLTFCCSMIPGAGQMYLGFMKKGVSIMLVFTLITALSGFFNLGLFAILLPVIWFYSFFDTFNLRSMTDEERFLQEDKFLFDLNGVLSRDWGTFLGKRHYLVGWGCIFFGAYLLFRIFISPALNWLMDFAPWIYNIIRNLPTLIVAGLIILFGFYLISGGKKRAPLPKEDDYVEYGGDHHDRN